MPSSYKKCFEILQHNGTLFYGSVFKLEPKDYNIIEKLISWSIHDNSTADKLEINLNKGILLSGPVGCGKSSLMNLMRYLVLHRSPHIIKSCRDIAFEFEKNGFETVKKHASISHHPTTHIPYLKTYCFDDLGTEHALRHYGQECNIMAEIILSRYDLYIRNKMLTHFTTNFSADEIEKLYGARVRSRLREMCNLIAFPKDAPDKRR